jgi:hypothetical protein
MKGADEVFASTDALDHEFADEIDSLSELESWQETSKFINNPIVTIRRILHMYG